MRYLLLLVLALAMPEAYAEKKGVPQDEKKAAFMFVQSAESGTFEPGKDGTFKLTLKDVSPETVYFSDRPQRIAGGVANDKFLKGLGFTVENPPNAAIVLSEPKSKKEDVVVVTLANPSYDAKARTLVYEAKPLNKVDGTGLAFWAGQKDQSLPSSFSRVSVFIDDCPDTQAYCYGSYETGGQRKCRVTCGTLGKKVGQCWSYLPPGCSPCHSYLSECTASDGPCNVSIDPACTKHSCSMSRDCM